MSKLYFLFLSENNIDLYKNFSKSGDFLSYKLKKF